MEYMKAIAFAAFVAALAVMLPAWASEPNSPAGAIAAEYAWVRALETRDLPALRARLAPEFLHTTWRGVLLGRSETLRAAAAAKPMKNSLSKLQARTFGDVAIVHGVNTVGSPDGSVARVGFTDVFVYRGGAWRAISAQETLQR
jgi:ketosteroid isomerase-like protein